MARQLEQTTFGAEDLKRGLARLHELALSSGITVEMAVYGGAAMILAWNMRRMTRDVDAIVVNAAHSGFVKQAAARIADEHGWH